MERDETKKAKLDRILEREPATMQNGAYCFLPGDRRPERTAGTGLQGRLQDSLKRLGLLYKILVWCFSPVLRTPAVYNRIRGMLERYSEKDTILSLGSGPRHVGGRQDIINLDIYAFQEVDIVADSRNVPIRDGSVDLVLSLSLLEHVGHPEQALSEMSRLLKNGGHVLCITPFMQPMHAAPSDFQRWTSHGLKRLFGGFEEVEIAVAAGPTSGMIWPLAEWLALLLSFGSRSLRDVLFLVLMILTSPLKLLDLYLVHLPGAERVASAFVVVGRKGAEPQATFQREGRDEPK